MVSPQVNPEAFQKSHWSAEDKKNVSVVLEFVQLIMNDHNFEEVLSKYKGEPYLQHNRNMTIGIEGVIEALGDLVKTAPEFSYDVKQVFVDGEFVIVHSHATLKTAHRGDDTKGLNIIDTWRVKEGKLVEHWDAVQGLSFSMRFYGLLAGGKVRNSNGVF